MHSANEPEKINQRDPAAELSAADTRMLSSELQALEAAWAQLHPCATQIDRDRLLFLAGQASIAGRGRHSAGKRFLSWYWPISSVGMTGVAAALFCALLLRDGLPVSERMVVKQPNVGTYQANAPAITERVSRPAAKDSQADEMEIWAAGRHFNLDDVLTHESIAATIANLDGHLPESDVEEAILSARSFQKLLDESEHPRG